MRDLLHDLHEAGKLPITEWLACILVLAFIAWALSLNAFDLDMAWGWDRQ